MEILFNVNSSLCSSHKVIIAFSAWTIWKTESIIDTSLIWGGDKSVNTPKEVNLKFLFLLWNMAREHVADKNGSLQSEKAAGCVSTVLFKVSVIYPNTL